MRLKKLLIASLAGTAVVLSATAVPASAAPAPKSYKNCTELNKDYPHGVGRKGARDKTSGKPVTNFRVGQHRLRLQRRRRAAPRRVRPATVTTTASPAKSG